MSTQHYPICMAEEYWADSYFSVARYYGGINMEPYKIVNKEGITIFELSDPENEHYVGDGTPVATRELSREEAVDLFALLAKNVLV